MYASSETPAAPVEDDSVPDGAPRAGGRLRFELRFEAALDRLDAAGREPDLWEEETLLSALGAAGLGEYELAEGLVDTATGPRSPAARPREFRRLPMSVATLRRRYERLHPQG